MGEYPIPDVDTLAHVERVPVESVKHIDAGRIGQRLDQGRIYLRGQGRRLEELVDGKTETRSIDMFRHSLQKIPDDLRIVQRPMPVFAAYAEPLDDAVEVVSAMFRKELAREPCAAQASGGEIDAHTLKLMTHKAVIEPCIVGNKDATVQDPQKLFLDVAERWCPSQIPVCNTGEALDVVRDVPLRVDERGIRLDQIPIFDSEYAYFNDAIIRSTCTCGLNIDYSQVKFVH